MNVIGIKFLTGKISNPFHSLNNCRGRDYRTIYAYFRWKTEHMQRSTHDREKHTHTHSLLSSKLVFYCERLKKLGSLNVFIQLVNWHNDILTHQIHWMEHASERHRIKNIESLRRERESGRQKKCNVCTFSLHHLSNLNWLFLMVLHYPHWQKSARKHNPHIHDGVTEWDEKRAPLLNLNVTSLPEKNVPHKNTWPKSENNCCHYWTDPN